jgi:hypothetical protein
MPMNDDQHNYYITRELINDGLGNLNLLMVNIDPIHSLEYIRKYIWSCKTIHINVRGTLLVIVEDSRTIFITPLIIL